MTAYLHAARLLLIEVEKYDGEPLVEDYERAPFFAAGVDSEDAPAYLVPSSEN